jgi:beta-galactosidase
MRERLKLDRNWRFALGHAADASQDFEYTRDRSLVKAGEARGAASPAFDDRRWRLINLPHDWAIELPIIRKDDRENREHGFRAIGPDYPQHSVGWYRRTFHVPGSDAGRRVAIEFDGVFRNSIVWVNGHRMGANASGYVGFRYDLTDVLNYGKSNVVAVRVDASCWEGWWYEGAGIYRHVWLEKTAPLHIAPHGTFVTSRMHRDGASVIVQTDVVNDDDQPAEFKLISTIGNKRSSTSRLKLKPWDKTQITQTITLKRARLWSPQAPNLYAVQSALLRGKSVVDRYGTTFGIRSFRWDARRGFFLNGKRLQIKGTCNHQQHAGVGIALPDRLQSLRVEKLKALGSNAYRASHYAATPELLDACDRLGLLVMAENRLAGSSPEVLSQLDRMIRRDRNHASIFLWSIGNEEHTVQWSIAGERIGRTMVRMAHRLDPTRKVTAAMHDRGLGTGFSNVVDVHGWNYIGVGNIDRFHRRRPEQPIVGSEEGSTLGTRGIYADDVSRGYVSAYDARAPGWGSTAEKWWTFFVHRPWLAGAFVWTGFDYYGEPIPYKWPCTSSHFGLMDLCGFPKDLYYYFQSCWSDRPVLHLFPHWNWPTRPKKPIDVRVFSNCDEVELILNHRSLGRMKMPPHSHLAWQVKYEPGTLTARGFKAGRQITQHVRTAGPAARIVLESDRPSIRADGEDVALVKVSMVDAENVFIPTAGKLIEFRVTGAGSQLGVGNGDPSCHESDKAPRRKLFNGLAMALVQSSGATGNIQVIARASGLKPARIQIQAG